MYRLTIFVIFFFSPLYAQPVCRHGHAECKLVNQWYEDEAAAGNRGDYYDNRDGGHSGLDMTKFPQLGTIEYAPEARERKQDWGAQLHTLNGIVVGNSSTSSDPHDYGSNARAFFYTPPRGIELLYRQYRLNNLYVYPEHRDCDPGHSGYPEGFGDLFPTNTPYLIISQGSSGSDQPFVQAVTHTLAAFHPEVKQALASKGMLMPTVQLLMRKAMKDIDTDEDYLSGKAHPTVFDGAHLSPVKMVEAAHSLDKNSLPPMAVLNLLQEEFDDPFNDHYPFEGSEQLHTTPNAIARVWRGPSHQRKMLISALNSFDLNNRPLIFEWRLLRGDPSRVTIKPSLDGAMAEVIVQHHPRMPVAEGSPLESNRVDIGLFAHNGVHYSPPSFVTFFMLDNELRAYDEKKRLVDILMDTRELHFDITDEKALLNLLAGTENLPRTLLLQHIPRDRRQEVVDWATNELAVVGDPQHPHLELFDSDEHYQLVKQALESIVEDPAFLFRNSGTIEGWADASATVVKERWYVQKESVRFLDLNSRPQNEVQMRLIQEHNLQVMCNVLFYAFLRNDSVPNFVDKRINNPPPSRYRYEYADGPAPVARHEYERLGLGWVKD